MKTMLKSKIWNVFLLKFSFVLIGLCFPPNVRSEKLRDYDIWNDKVQKKSFMNNVDHPTEHGARQGKILSYFYPSTEDECLASDRRRSGTCLNPYRCHQRGGTSSGPCAHGFGVCCVFSVSCGKEMKNNMTYFVSPEFPSLARSMDSCSLVVHKMEGASQLRLDFVHFNLGQPNRMTGECDSDLFTLSSGKAKDFKLCGMNSGQHIYYDLDSSVKFVRMSMRLTRPTLQRLWEIRVTQVPFAQRAPDGCLQFFTAPSGILQTFNFAENGRHLADQNYRACVRQEGGMCSIAYEPCDQESFRIGPSVVQGALYGYGGMGVFGGGPGAFGGPPGSFGGPGSEFMGPVEQVGEVQDATNVEMVEDTLNDQALGSGDGAVPATRSDDSPPDTLEDRFPSPYSQYLSALGGPGDPGNAGGELWRYSGYGNYGQGVSSFGRQGCRDRIVTPCDGDEFLGTSAYSPGVCDPYHCGPSLCQGVIRGRRRQAAMGGCRVETSHTPFFVAVNFGPPAPKPNPEDNIGACLRYEQLTCV